jgi:hypothetical protein
MNSIHRNRPAATPAYYLGRSATVWQTALRRRPHPRHDAPSLGPTD